MKKYFLLLVFSFVSFNTQAGMPQALVGVIDQIYGANTVVAKSTIATYIAANPADANGYLLRGIAAEWDQLTHDKGNSLDSQIMSDYQKSRTLAEDDLAKTPDDVNKKIMLGNALIYVSKKQLDLGHKVQAGNTLKLANNLMKEVLEKDASNSEAYFAMGLFNYFAANVPAGFKWLAALLGFKGDATLGLKYLNLAASANSITQGDAKFMLVYVYGNKEKNYATAMKFANELYGRYPKNSVFLYNIAETLYNAKQLDESRANFEKLITHCETKPTECNDRYNFSANYYVTKIYMDQKNNEMAKKQLVKAVALDKNKFKNRTADLKKWAGLLN